MTPFKAMEVLKAASVFKVERLSQMCQRYLQANVSLENIYKLLKQSDTMNVEKGKQICMEFALENSGFFTSDCAESLGFKLYQEVTASMLKSHQGLKTSEGNKIQLTSPDTIVEDFKAVWEDQASKDVTFHIQGQDVKAHKALMMGHSQEFNAFVFHLEESLKTKGPGHITLDEKYGGISAGAFEDMLRFFYYNYEFSDVCHACQLFVFSRDFNLVKLSNLIEQVIDKGVLSVSTVLPLLGVAYNPLMNDNPALQSKIKDQGIQFVVQHVTVIDFIPLQKMPAIIGTQILEKLQQALSSSWQSLIAGTLTFSPSLLQTSSSSKKPLPISKTEPSSVNDTLTTAQSVPTIPSYPPPPPLDVPPPAVTSPDESDDALLRSAKSDPRISTSQSARDKKSKTKSKKEKKKLAK